ncbi:Acyl-coenzyme A oxidase 2 peroxisomal [Euphorbia peplus]|nr:Acyl-coenzyme A oxidase 2 peroxisomal [Euphorbia peplus]
MQPEKLRMNRRIEQLRMHLEPVSRGESQEVWMGECRGNKESNLQVKGEKLAVYMRGKHRDIQEKVIDYFRSKPELVTPVEVSKDEHRDLCWKQLIGLVREAGIKPFKYIFDDPAQYFAIADAVGSVDISLAIKFGVQFRSHPFLISSSFVEKKFS